MNIKITITNYTKLKPTIKTETNEVRSYRIHLVTFSYISCLSLSLSKLSFIVYVVAEGQRDKEKLSGHHDHPTYDLSCHQYFLGGH